MAKIVAKTSISVASKWRLWRNTAKSSVSGLLSKHVEHNFCGVSKSPRSTSLTSNILLYTRMDDLIFHIRIKNSMKSIGNHLRGERNNGKSTCLSNNFHLHHPQVYLSHGAFEEASMSWIRNRYIVLSLLIIETLNNFFYIYVVCFFL